MNKWMTVLLVGASAVAFAATVQGAEDKLKPLTKEEVRKLTPEQRKARRDAALVKMGGIVETAREGKVVSVVNAQKRVGSEKVEATVAKMRSLTMLPFARHDESAFDGSVNKRASAIVGEKVGAVIFVIDRAGEPSLMIAPDQRWAAVNVATLADGVDDATLSSRVNKEIWRAAVMMLGGSNSMYQPCLMQTILELKDLDDIKLDTTTPEPFAKMSRTCRDYGINPARRGTYRSACKEGWAPAPTNEIQKVIWEEFHAKPTEPMKIEFDKTKGE